MSKIDDWLKPGALVPVNYESVRLLVDHIKTMYGIQEPKPDFNQTMDVYINKMYKHYPNDFRKQRLMIDKFALLGTMNLTFDGTTGQLKSAEVL